MGGYGSAIGSSVSNNPELWLYLSGQLARAAGAPYLSMPLTALGGIAEARQRPARLEEYMRVLRRSEGLPEPPEVPGEEPRIPTPEERAEARIRLGQLPRPRTSAEIAGTVGAELQATQQDIRRREQVLEATKAQPLPVPPPQILTLPARTPQSGRGLPLSAVARILVSRRRFSPE